MAFSLQSFARVSASGNEPINILQDGTTFIGSTRIYTYVAGGVSGISGDTQAQIAASGYFNSIAGDLQTNDMIYATSINEGTTVLLSVTNSNEYGTPGFGGTITTSAVATSTPVGTANISDAAITTAKIADGDVTLAKLDAGIEPSHVIKFAGQATTVGGAAAEAFTVTGAVAATDRAFVQVVDNGTSNVTVLQAVVTTNTLTVTFSANPGNDTIINYQIIRVVS